MSLLHLLLYFILRTGNRILIVNIFINKLIILGGNHSITKLIYSLVYSHP
jgi:hypothetical protein